MSDIVWMASNVFLLAWRRSNRRTVIELRARARSASLAPLSRWRLFGSIAAVLMVGGSAASVHYSYPPALQPSRASIPANSASSIAIKLPPPDLLRPISPEQAVKENAKVEFSQRPDQPAARFAIAADAPTRKQAIDCLAQAIYYEAATEGIDGGRAVAQVVLNRTRHPAYPSSVCGVVYQGSQLETGCQFSFTCDGSLRRVPLAHLWVRSRKIAEEALAGQVFGMVGHATHYHADYVLPYWAASLDKMVKIGRHIFYRLPAALGSPRTFRQAYSGREPLVVPHVSDQSVAPTSAIVALVSGEMEEEIVSPEASTRTPLLHDEAVANSPEMAAVLADARQGSLLNDEAQPVIATVEPKRAKDCPDRDDDTKLRPLGANDLRSHRASESQAASCG